MKKIFAILALAAALFVSFNAFSAEKTYKCNIGTRYEIRNDAAVAVPLQCSLTVSETGAKLSFVDATGLNTYTARSAERVSNTFIAFKGFVCSLPDGTLGRIVCAEEHEDGLMVVFRPAGGGENHTYWFNAKE